MATRTWGGGSNSPPDGLWSTPANWTGDSVPQDNDDVVFDATSTVACLYDGSSSLNPVSLTLAVGYGSTLTIADGYQLLMPASGTLSIAAGCTLTGTGTGLFRMTNGSSITLQAGTFSVPNVTMLQQVGIAAGVYGGNWSCYNNSTTVSKTFSLNGNVTFNGNVSWDADKTDRTYTVKTNNNSVIFQGDVALLQSAGTVAWTKGTGTITLSGTADQDVNFAGLAVEDIEINKTAGSVSLTGDVTADSLTLTDGTLDIDGHDLTTVGNFTAAAGTMVADTAATGLIVVGGNFALNGTIAEGITWSDADLDITGTATASYATASGSDASSGTEVDADDGTNTDGTGNLNWLFASPTNPVPVFMHHYATMRA